MALSIATIKAELKLQRESLVGPPANAAQADILLTADAKALFNILTVLGSVKLNSGVDTNGDALVDDTGKLI